MDGNLEQARRATGRGGSTRLAGPVVTVPDGPEQDDSAVGPHPARHAGTADPGARLADGATASPAIPPLRRRWRHPVRAAILLLGLPLVALLLLPLLLLGQEVTAPSWLRERVEAEATTLLGGGSIGFGAITLTVGRDLHPHLRLLEAELHDAEGRVLARVPELSATLSPRGLLDGRILVQAISVHGAEAQLTRARDGSVDVAVAVAEAPSGSRLGRARGLAAIPDEVERLFERPALEALRRVEVEGLVVNYDDARAGRTWTLDGGTLVLDLSGGEARLTGEVSLLSGRTYVTRARIDYRSPRGSPEAQIGVTLTDVAAGDIASQSAALAWLSVVEAPISAALRVSIDGEGRLGPLHAALKIAEGQVRPDPAAPPVGFEVARAYLSYDPATQAMDVERLEVRSDWGSFTAGGRAYLRDVRDGMPRSILGQFDLADASLAPPGVLSEPLVLSDATADVRLRLAPFSLDVVQASAVDEGGADVPGLGRILASGRVGASADGWSVALDAQVAEASRDRLLGLWPEGWRPQLRGWMEANLTAGRATEATVALRVVPGREARLAATARFDGVEVRPLASHPPIRDAAGRLAWDTGALMLALDSGRVDAPEGGAMALAGTTFTLPAGGGDRPPARIAFVAEGPITAALSLLDMPPLGLLTAAALPVDVAEGSGRATGTVDIRLGSMTPDELRYEVAATLSDVRSDGLVPGWTLTGTGLSVAATEGGLAIEGPVRLGGIAAQGRWSQQRDAPGRSRVEAEVLVTPAAMAELGIALPDGAVGGEGRGDLALDFVAGQAPRFAFSSSLDGLRLALPEMGWAKGAGTSGSLEVTGRLGSPVSIDRLALSAPGLSAEGDMAITAGGALGRLDLDRLTVGDWFDAPVTLTGRGRDATPGIEVRGGRIDLAGSQFGTGGDGEGGPVAVRLDTLQVTEGIALTDVEAELSTAAGLEGTFQGLVNGRAAVTGRVAPQDGRVGARLQGDDAGAVMEAAGLFTRAEGGTLDLLLLPVGEASYDGEAFVTGLRVREAPVLASLLNAVSVVGLLQQLGGQGIVFEQVAADFRIDPDRITLERSSAVGAGLGLSMDGTYDILADRMDFQGVFSPLYLINGIGQIFSRPGEGLIGFNYSLAGAPASPQVGVNPLSALTPGMFRDIFRRAPPGQ